jgi:serine O-acetyltransferase
MIQSKEDYMFYLEADRIGLTIEHKRPKIIGDDVWKFQRLLRKVEYYTNCKKDIFSKIFVSYLNYRLYKQSIRLGFWIPVNVFGPGLSIGFYSGPIVVNYKSTIGENCRISQGVTIGGGADLEHKGPTIGNNVFIGPGAVIIGPLKIGDNIAIGANSFVNKSFTEKGITIAGVPAKKVADKHVELAVSATEILRKHLSHK